MRRAPFVLLLLGPGGLAFGCGPTDLAGNVEKAGPIDEPFAVSDFFAASGFMGDGMLPGFLTADVDEECKSRPPEVDGNCYRFVYRVGEEKWAGVYWQYPANNWGSQPGRSVATQFERVRFFVAGEYDIVLPEGGGIGASCGDTSGCRPGLGCEAGSCAPAADRPLGERCIVSAECADGGQCVGQRCVVEGEGAEGAACAEGGDGACAGGLRCGLEGGALLCLPEGPGDVGARCESRNECRAGLYCREGACAPKTNLGPFHFQVGGVAPTKAGLIYSDQIGVSYFASAGKPQPVVGPDWQEFTIDLTNAGDFDALIGAFMWAVPFPNIDEMREDRPYPYLADRDKPVLIYVDGIVFE